MRTFLSLALVTLLLGSWSPLVLAGEEDKDRGDSTEEGGTTGEEESDPWSAPAATEKPAAGEEGATKTEGETTSTEATSSEETTPEVVTPSNYPIAEIDRPLALPPMTLEPYGVFGLVHLVDNIVSLNFGASIGVTDNIEAGIGGYQQLALWGPGFPIMLSPKFDVGDMGLYGLYELNPMMDGNLRLAGRLTLNLPLQTDFGLTLDVPVKFKLNDMFAAVGGLGMGLRFPKDNTTFLLLFDFGALVQPIEALAVSLLFGVHVGVADSTQTLIPLTLRAQYTLMGDLDAFMEFGFGDLKEAGADWIVFLLGASYRLAL